MTASATDRF